MLWLTFCVADKNRFIQVLFIFFVGKEQYLQICSFYVPTTHFKV